MIKTEYLYNDTRHLIEEKDQKDLIYHQKSLYIYNYL